MATAPDPNEDDNVLELTEDQQIDEPEVQGDERGDDDEPDAEVNDEGGEEETVVSFGDDAADQPDDSSTMRHMREKLREKDQRIRELESSAPKSQKIEIGEKPTLAGCDYDEDKYEAELEAFNGRKTEAAAQERQQSEANAEVQREWESDVAAFTEKRARLAPTIPDFDDLQQTVAASLDLAQQAVLVKAANDPALFMAALGKNPAKLAELAKIKDVIKLGAAIARMEGGIKVVTKRKAPAPDRPQRGSAVIEASDKKLERLEAEAEKTGDRTNLIAYKKELKVKK